MKRKVILLLLIFSFNMNYSQKGEDVLYRKWMVYSTVSTALNGWNSFDDSYILDFTDQKKLKIKTLGQSKIETVEYTFDNATGIIYETNRDVLYKIKELSTNQLVLIMGENDEVNVFLTSLKDCSSKVNLNSLSDILKKDKWSNNDDSILFTDQKYKVANEVETNYNVFTEVNNKTNKPYKGAWLIDSYDNIVFLELFSERINHKAIYILESLNQSLIKGNAFNKKGESLLLELYR